MHEVTPNSPEKQEVSFTGDVHPSWFGASLTGPGIELEGSLPALPLPAKVPQISEKPVAARKATAEEKIASKSLEKIGKLVKWVDELSSPTQPLRTRWAALHRLSEVHGKSVDIVRETLDRDPVLAKLIDPLWPSVAQYTESAMSSLKQGNKRMRQVLKFEETEEIEPKEVERRILSGLTNGVQEKLVLELLKPLQEQDSAVSQVGQVFEQCVRMEILSSEDISGALKAAATVGALREQSFKRYMQAGGTEFVKNICFVASAFEVFELNTANSVTTLRGELCRVGEQLADFLEKRGYARISAA